VSESKIVVDISGLDINHYPRAKKALKQAGFYVIDLIDGVSMAINALIGGNPAETLSSRAFRTDTRIWNVFGKTLDLVLTPRADNYCCKSYNRCLERSKALLGNRFR
tara:strand:- start:3045 stop:3365 length:321 start_codon:yes stop_codon:yes gene_type:complete